MQEKKDAEGLRIYYDNDALCCWMQICDKEDSDNAHCSFALRCRGRMDVFVVDNKGTMVQSEVTSPQQCDPTHGGAML